MQTNIKFDRLKAMPLETAKLALKQAIDFELKLPMVIMDMFERNPATLYKMLKAVKGGNFDAGPTEAHFKSFLGAKYATASNNPILTDLSAQFAAFFHSNMPDIDTGWMQLFDLVDLRTSPHDHFDIDDTNAGITYTQIKPGAQIKKRTNITESKLSVPYLTFGAGLGILDDWITKQMYWKIDEVIAEFRAKWYDILASIHYGLFTAIGTGINQSFTVDDPTTFNASAAVLIRNLRTMGYSTGQNANFKIICAPEKIGRVQKMLTAQQGSQIVAFGTVKEPIAYTVDAVVSSVFVPANDLGYYLLLPGKKIKRGVWQDLSVEQQRDAASRATDWYASGQVNAAIGDTNQVVRVKYA
ncbi:MAG: hypothetical protein P4L92_23070 [Rudaea sp.]|nr:hypothetical protein [Rudaea sp.]